MLCSGNSDLGEVEIKQGIFQGDSLSPLVIPLSLTLRKAKAAYEFSESKEKISYLLFMDDLKLYSRSEKGFGKGKIVRSDCELPDGKVIRSL